MQLTQNKYIHDRRLFPALNRDVNPRVFSSPTLVGILNQSKYHLSLLRIGSIIPRSHKFKRRCLFILSNLRNPNGNFPSIINKSSLRCVGAKPSNWNWKSDGDPYAQSCEQWHFPLSGPGKPTLIENYLKPLDIFNNDTHFPQGINKPNPLESYHSKAFIKEDQEAELTKSYLQKQQSSSSM